MFQLGHYSKLIEQQLITFSAPLLKPLLWVEIALGQWVLAKLAAATPYASSYGL